MLIEDEDDLRAGLRVLSTPPPQPTERVERAVSRARAVRRRRAALAGAAVLMPAVALGAVALRPAPSPTLDLTNVLNWPERRDPDLAQIERNVLTEWAYGPTEALAPDETVRWLYSGRVPGTDSVVVAFATCRPGHCTRTVLAHGDQAEMAEHPKDDSSTDWLTQTRELAPGEPVGALSEYLDSAARPEEGPTTVLFVLAAPDAGQVTYTAPTREGSGSSSGPLTLTGGAFVRDVGYLEAPAVVTVVRADGSFAYQGRVGDEDSVGNARLIVGIDVPAGYADSGWSGGQLMSPLSSQDGALSRSAPHALFVRCVAASPLRVEMHGAKREVPCDGRVHRATPVVPPIMVEFRPGLGKQAAFEYHLDSDDPYTVYALALAKRV